jgi:PAS domain S-box-containing protein
VPVVNLSHRKWFQAVLATNDFALGGFQLRQPDGLPSLGMGYPVRDAQGQIVAVVAASLSLSALNEAAAATALPADTQLLLLDHAGTVVAHVPDAAAWLGQAFPDTPLVAYMLAGQPFTAELSGLDGTRRVYAGLALPGDLGLPAHLALGRPAASVYGAANTVQQRNLTGLALILALTLITIWQGSRVLILRPVRALRDATRRLTAGDLAARTGLPQAGGELGELAHAFDHLADTLAQRSVERDRAEAALRQSEEHYRRLVELSPDAVLVLQDNLLVYLNSAGARLLGGAPDELLGRAALADCVDPADRPQVLPALAAAAAGGRLPYLETRWRNYAGRPLEAELSASATEHAGRPALLVVVRDISDRKQAARRAQALADAGQALAALSRDPAAVLDHVVRVATEQVGDLAVLRVLSDDGAQLVHTVMRGDDDFAAALAANLRAGDRAAAGLTGRLLATGEPLLVAAVDPAALAAAGPPETRAFFAQVPAHGLIGVPLRSHGRMLGVLGMLRARPGRPYTPGDLAFAQALADRAALALDNARLYALERAAREAAEAAARQAARQTERVARLQIVTAACSQALTPAQALEVMLEQGVAALDAAAAAVVLLADDGQSLDVAATRNFPETAVVARLPLDSPAPAAQVVRDGQPIWIESQADFAAHYPGFAAVRARAPFESVAYLPLEVEGRPLGCLAISFGPPRRFAPDERDLLLAVARQGAQALARTRRYDSERAARAQAEGARQQLAFLAGASAALAASLDLEVTLQAVARLVVPTAADYCLVYLFDRAGAVHTAALAHSDPDQEPLVRELDRLYRPTPGDDQSLFGQAVLYREPRFVEDVPPETYQAAVRGDPAVADLLHRLGVRSVLHAPLVSGAYGGPVRGVIALIYTDSGRRYSILDVPLARELARRTALAIENAEHYAEAQRLNAELEQRVARRTTQLEAANASLEAEVAERRRVETALEASQAQLRDLNAYAQAAREEERGRISREIHDELGGALTGLKMDVARIRKLVAGVEVPGAGKAAVQLDALSRAIDATVQTVRRIATELRPALLDDFGLVAAIEWQLQEFQSRSGLACDLANDLPEINWDPAASTAVFRVFQEALTNIARHAQATRVDVALAEAESRLVMRIHDDGRGLDTGSLAERASLGLAGMRERVRLLEGELNLHSAPGQGTLILIQIPMQRLRRLGGAMEQNA